MRLVSLRGRGIGPAFRASEFNLDLAKIPGKLLAVVGANGAGKTTMLGCWPGALYRDIATRGSLVDLAKAAGVKDAFVEAVVETPRRLTIRITADGVSKAGGSEAIVLDEAGAPVLSTTSVKAFDAWAAVHLPPRAVFDSTMFTAQGSSGWVGMTAAERKAVVLRTLGVERLEALAEKAREHARDASNAIATLGTRIDAERSSSALTAGADEALSNARALVGTREAALKNAQAELTASREKHATLVAAFNDAEAARKRRDGATSALAAARQSHDALVRRGNDQRAVLADAEKVRAAEKEVERLDVEIAKANAAVSTAEAACVEAKRAMKDADAAVLAIEQRAADASAAESVASERIAALTFRANALRPDVANAAAVRQAVADLPAREAALRDAVTVEAEAVEKARELQAALSDALRRHGDATRRHQAAASRETSERARTVELPAAQAAREQVEPLRASASAISDDHAAAWAALEKLQNGTMTIATRRIDGLRGGLKRLVALGRPPHSYSGADLADGAQDCLTADDDEVAAFNESPGKITAAQEKWRAIGAKHKTAYEAYQAAETLVARIPDLERSQREADAALAERDAAAADAKSASDVIADTNTKLAAHRLTVETATDARRTAEQLAAQTRLKADGLSAVVAAETALAEIERQIPTHEAAGAEARAQFDAATVDAEAADDRAHEARMHEAECYATALRASSDRAKLIDARKAAGTVAARAPAITAAEAVLSEIEGRFPDSERAVTRAQAELALCPEVPAVAPVPDLAAQEAAVAAAETRLTEARNAEARAEKTLEDAAAAAARVAALEAERAAMDEDLADWNKLAEDLGQRGLIAMEVDAAGPELSAIATQLVHECFGVRWTLTIETTRAKASGDGSVEVCDVRVLDTKDGTEVPIEKKSGGQLVILSQAVRLALMTVACRRSGVVGATLVLDESGAALDEESRPAFVSMLRRAAELVNADKVLIVTHDSTVADLCDARVRVDGGRVTVN